MLRYRNAEAFLVIFISKYMLLVLKLHATFNRIKKRNDKRGPLRVPLHMWVWKGYRTALINLYNVKVPNAFFMPVLFISCRAQYVCLGGCRR